MSLVSKNVMLCIAALTLTAGSGNWLEGRRFSASESEDVIAEWAKSFTE